MQLPKPKPCNQVWQDMTPVLNGRRCEMCSKLVVDFSQMKWAEIRQIQDRGDFSICGFYSKNQIENWDGVSNKLGKGKFVKWISILIWLGTSWPTYGQAKTNEIKVHGTISGGNGKLDGVKVRLKGTSNYAQSDSNGSYELVVKEPYALIEDIAVVFEKPGYSPVELHLTGGTTSDVNYNTRLYEVTTREDLKRMPPRTSTAYYASGYESPKNSFWKRIYRTLLFWRN